MTVEHLTADAWLVQLTGSEAADMGCTGEDCGSALADRAAELTGCGGDYAAQIYYGQGEVLLFLTRRSAHCILLHFADLEALLGAAAALDSGAEADLYAAPEGYILTLPDGFSPAVWDFGRPLPYSALHGAAPLIKGTAAAQLREVFGL